jgi:hypothetical protein
MELNNVILKQNMVGGMKRIDRKTIRTRFANSDAKYGNKASQEETG